MDLIVKTLNITLQNCYVYYCEDIVINQYKLHLQCYCQG